MNKGYLICKEVYEGLEEFEVERKIIDPSNKDTLLLGDNNEKVKAIKCPLTGEYVEKS